MDDKKITEAKSLTQDLVNTLLDEIEERGLKEFPAAFPHVVMLNMLLHILFYVNKKNPNDHPELYESLATDLEGAIDQIDKTIEEVLGIGS